MHPMNSAPAMRLTAKHARLAPSRLARAGFLSALLCFGCGLPGSIAVALAQEDLVIYDDALREGWQNWSWATVNLANPSPTHGGSDSISVTTANYSALYLHHDAFDSALYTNLTFWIHGGPTGGQSLKVQATVNGQATNAVNLPSLPANTWQQITLSLAALHVANNPNMDGFWIQSLASATQPTFFVDDIKLVAAPVPAVVHVSINATQVVRTVDARSFGVNAAVWDSSFDSGTTASWLTEMGNQALRFPGGSLSDEYHWASNTSGTNTWTWATSFDKFAHVATNTAAQVFVTVNYGTGTPQEATDWVRYANVTKNYGFKLWEIGNENYGGWETDANSLAHDPFTYATRAKDYIAQMKAVDPTIRIGVVAVTGEESYSNGYTNHTATNPRTGQSHNGWTPVMLTTLKNLGVTPDFLIYHKYAQNAGQESDALLLQSSRTWIGDAADLRRQWTDYLGAAGTNIELICTENNSISSGPGKQTTSLVNGLFRADSFGQILQTEFNALIWWDLRNGQDPNNNNSASLYGWRQYGDYGVVSGTNDRYPTFYVGKLLKFFARGGDRVVPASSDYSLLGAYATRRADGSLSVMVINKSAANALNANLALAGYAPDSNAVVYSYGIPQDDAARTGIGSANIGQTNWTGAGTNFSFSFAPYSATVLALQPGPPRLASGVMHPDGQFELQILGAAGASYVLQVSTNFLDWPSLATNTLTDTSVNFTDGQATNSPGRFYRAARVP